jgi:hypothetical protein
MKNNNLILSLFPEKTKDETLKHIIFKGTPSQFYDKMIKEFGERQKEWRKSEVKDEQEA